MSTYIGKWRWVNEEDDTKALLGIVVQEDPDQYPPLLVYKNQSMSEFDVMAWFESEEIASLAAERIDRILTADEFARIGGATVAEGLGLRGEEANDHPGVEWVCALKDNDDPDPAVRVTGGAHGSARLWAVPSTDGEVFALFTYVNDERWILAEFTSEVMANNFVEFVDGCRDA
ncbi:MAG: hypothetical protein V9G04_04985 [Nocardioides sp.]|jgi:hypothetical protein